MPWRYEEKKSTRYRMLKLRRERDVKEEMLWSRLLCGGKVDCKKENGRGSGA